MKTASSMTLDRDDLYRVVAQALAEDIGAGDITSNLTIPENAIATIHFVAGQPLVACGTFVPEAVYHELEKTTEITIQAKEGQKLEAGEVLVTARGPARALLSGERVALNLMQHLCGVSTLTRQYVDAVKGTRAVILDTRKTLPGLRFLDKYAVRTGGGKNHRMRLDDAVLIKDNHIAVWIQDSGFGILELVQNVKEKLTSRTPNPESRTPIIIECDTLAQLDEALKTNVDRIMLDNMPLADIREAVARTEGRIPLEASGGVSLQTVRAIAETGVDFISVGKITHSAPAADIHADIEIKSRF